MVYERGQGEIPFQVRRNPITGAFIPESYYYLWDSDLSRLGREVYGKPVNFLKWFSEEEHFGQDYCEFVNIPEVDNDEWDGQDLPTFEQWVNTPLDQEPPRGTIEFYHWEERWENWHPQRQAIYNDLHTRGLLPTGKYVIHCWW